MMRSLGSAPTKGSFGSGRNSPVVMIGRIRQRAAHQDICIVEAPLIELGFPDADFRCAMVISNQDPRRSRMTCSKPERTASAIARSQTCFRLAA